MYLLFDTGGTKMRVALSRDRRKLEEPIVFPTPRNFKEGIEKLEKIADESGGKEKVEAIGGGLAGTLNRRRTRLISRGNIPEWLDIPLVEELNKAFQGAKVFLENDAALAGLGEAVRGSGKGKEIVVYLTVSTGLGGARIVNGRIDKSAFGFEPAYQIIDVDRSLYPELKIRRFGEFISGNGLQKRFGKPPEEIKDPILQDELAKLLAVGLNNSIVHWSPDMVILGGSVMNIIPIDRVRHYLKETLRPYPEIPEIAPAALGDFSGLYGALEYLKGFL